MSLVIEEKSATPALPPTAAPAADKKNMPSAQFKRRLMVLIAIILLVVGLSVYLKFNFWLFFTDFHYVADLLGEMLPPNFSILLQKDDILASIAQTIAMAFLGTLIGGSLALGLAFFAAANTNSSRVVRSVIRALLALERATPNLIVVLILIIAVGLGPFAGMLSLAIGSVGMFGKLFADAIEGVESDPVEAIYAVGATKWQAIRYGILPEVLPSFIANLFYAFDINLRAAIGLGVFGGGGIGYELQMAMQMLRYRDALALISFTIILISLFEKISDYLRRKVMEREVLK